MPTTISKPSLNNGEFTQLVKELRDAYEYHLHYTMASGDSELTYLERYMAFSYAIRDRIVDSWLSHSEAYESNNVREVYYLSLEFLIGRVLGNNVINLELEKVAREVLKNDSMDWDRMRTYADDPGLGNGGLGRLAAYFLDSMATLDLPCMGYGLRYDYGIFRQQIINGQQVEEPDNWSRRGYPWEIIRPNSAATACFGGKVVFATIDGHQEWRWEPEERVIGMPYDIPIVGFGGKTVNSLRLWQARADNDFDFMNFNAGSYLQAVENKVLAENLTKVLYPNDSFAQGKELRLRQQYFFVACTLQDILRRFKRRKNDWSDLPDKVFIQLNDTHPALVIPELMRILLDDEHLGWEKAWEITSQCVAYTNHTILPEALEKWDLRMLERLLPRHLQIIYEINSRFLQRVSAMHPGDLGCLSRMSIIEGLDPNTQKIRMANLSVIGSKKVNGVARIHSEILKHTLFKDFADMYPERFTNMTNGITQRRWLLNANAPLADFISEKIGRNWITDLSELRRLEKFIDDDDFLNRLGDIKTENKKRLANLIRETIGVSVSTDSIFDVQVKRIHEYKRQLLLTLYIIMLYNRLCENPTLDIQPRTFIFAGKAAPGYLFAKLVIRLIHAVADVIRANPNVSKKINVVFLPDDRVSLAEVIIPAAEISEQISLAGTEASGTGNMKMMLNGALTLGTMDGANVEIHEEVGDDNIFIFGMRAEEVQQRRQNYSPWDIYHSDAEIRRTLDHLRLNTFSLLQPGMFDPVWRALLDNGDYYMLLADLRDYVRTQEIVDMRYRDRKAWLRSSLINIARAGKFSSDRTISNYASEIWQIDPFRK
ncbi:MAG: glycogen/starch/alpha-glucan phosphorylase [Victivallales bacterium]|nr:glycogen/starch/alpha-glucan phosphorylase [Victivallales bacterium]